MKIDENVVACITGGADGIGFALAQVLICNGASVALVDIRKEALENAQHKLMVMGKINVDKISTHVLDVRNREKIRDVLEEILQAHGGRISILFNSAGVFGGSGIDRLTYEDFDRVIDINLKGTVNMCKELFPVLTREHEAYIVNISSLDGLIAMPGALSYVTSKFAITGFTRALSMDLQLLSPNIHVASVHPGFVSTDIIKNNSAFLDPMAMVGAVREDLGEKIQAFMTPETIHQFQLKMSSTTPLRAAEQILNGMYWNRTRIVVGNDAMILDWIARVFPSALHHQFVFMPTLLVTMLAVRLIGKVQLVLVVFLLIVRRRLLH